MKPNDDKDYMQWWGGYGEMADYEVEYPAWLAGRAFQHRFEKTAADDAANKIIAYLNIEDVKPGSSESDISEIARLVQMIHNPADSLKNLVDTFPKSKKTGKPLMFTSAKRR